MADVKNQNPAINNNDVAAPTTGKLLLNIFGPGGRNYAGIITAEALMQAREMITKSAEKTTEVVGDSVGAYNETADAPQKHRLPRPDDVMRNQFVMEEIKLVNKKKEELEAVLGHKLELKPGQKLTPQSLQIQIDEAKQRNKEKLEHSLRNAPTPDLKR